MFRADAAFAKPEIYEALEERGAKYAIRIPANDSLLRDIAELLTRPVRPSEPQTRRVVQGLSLSGGQLEDGTASSGEGGVPCRGVVPAGGLHRDQHWRSPSRAVVRFYNKRGTAEQWIKEGKQAVKMTRLSCHRFRSQPGAAVR